MNSSDLCQKCAQQLEAATARIRQLTAFVGLDGFVDEIVHAVDKREDASHYRRILTIAQFSERLAAAAGQSTNIELVNQRTKLGGNGPIMAHALAALGLHVTYLGNVGYPTIHPVFADLAHRAEVHSIAEPCHTDALEFDDGKIMLGKSTQLNEVNWSVIQSRFGRGPFEMKFQNCDLLAFVNWTMIPYMSEIWEALLRDFCPRLQGLRRKIFFDLADPEKRCADDVQQAFKLITQFQKYFDVILGLNEKEAFQVGEALGIQSGDHSREGISNLAREIHCRLAIDTLAVHPVTYALAVGDGRIDLVDGPRISKALITTGAGDHFNAGFCLGKLLGFSNAYCVLLGVASSGYYVRSGESADVRGLVEMLRNWPAR
jgi:sugar/nucleoside kinase (ribokinase family)